MAAVALGMIFALPRLGIVGAAMVLAIVCGVASVIFWVLACLSLGVSSLSLFKSTSRGTGVTSLACGGVALIVMATPALKVIWELVLMALLGLASYMVILAKFGASP